MPIELPPHVARSLGLGSSVELADVIQTVDLLSVGVGPLSSGNSREIFKQLIQNPVYPEHFEVCSSSSEIAQWRFRSVHYDGSNCAHIVEIPAQQGREVPPPTAAESIIVSAWLASECLTDSSGQLRSNAVVFAWGRGILEQTKTIVRAICSVPNISGARSVPRVWSNASQINLQNDSRVLKHSDSELLRRLFYESATETVFRWRFLSLYRILEHGYLENVFLELSSKFFQEPEKSLASATNALKSEVEQFVRLVEVQGLKSHFEEISLINNRLVGQLNKFAILVDREAKRKKFSEPYKKGVAVIYQIRCSIVHAGSHSVVFDKTEGGEEMLAACMGELERAVIRFLGIQSS